MIILTLPIFHHNEESASKKEMGLDYDLMDCPVRPITFFNINAISAYKDTDGNEDFTSIFSNGSEFICHHNVDKVKQLMLEEIRRAL